MITVQSVKMVALEPLSYTNGATASLVVDTLGYDYATFFINLGRSNNATNVPSVLKIQSADVTNSSSYADVAGTSFTSTYTTAATAAGDNLMIGINTTPQKRYLKLLVSPVTTQVVGGTAVLSRPEVSPISNAQYGVTVAPVFI